MKSLNLLMLMMLFALASCGDRHLQIDKAASNAAGNGALTVEIPVE